MAPLCDGCDGLAAVLIAPLDHVVRHQLDRLRFGEELVVGTQVDVERSCKPNDREPTGPSRVVPEPEMGAFPGPDLRRARQHHLTSPTAVEDVLAEGIVLVLKNEVRSSIQAEKLKCDLVQRPDEFLVHPRGLLNRQSGEAALYLKVLDPNCHLVGTCWRDSDTLPRDDRPIPPLEADMRTIGSGLDGHSPRQGRRCPTGI